jgi:hypothetical protein
LEKIDYPGHKFYGRINEAYVPPSEYDEIVRALDENRIDGMFKSASLANERWKDGIRRRGSA